MRCDAIEGREFSFSDEMSILRGSCVRDTGREYGCAVPSVNLALPPVG